MFLLMLIFFYKTFASKISLLRKKKIVTSPLKQFSHVTKRVFVFKNNKKIYAIFKLQNMIYVNIIHNMKKQHVSTAIKICSISNTRIDNNSLSVGHKARHYFIKSMSLPAIYFEIWVGNRDRRTMVEFFSELWINYHFINIGRLLAGFPACRWLIGADIILPPLSYFLGKSGVGRKPTNSHILWKYPSATHKVNRQ